MAEQWWRETWKEAIYDSSLSTTCRFVAIVYAEHARDSRTAWAPISVLVRKTGLSRRSVINARNELRDTGWLTEVKAADRRSSAHFLLVIPDGVEVQEVHPTGESGVQEMHSGVQDVHLRGAGGAPNQSLINPHQSSLSAEQAFARDLLGLDDGDERLMKIPKILQDNNVRNAKVWLRRCHENGDLLDLLQSSTWGPSAVDDGLMANPHHIETWDTAERIKPEDHFRPQMANVLGATDDEIKSSVQEQRDIGPTWTEERIWANAYMDLENFLVCKVCHRGGGSHYTQCKYAAAAS